VGSIKDQGFLTIGEVARYLDIKVKTLYPKLSEIPHYRVGRPLRFRKEDIDAWMESKRRDGTEGTHSSRRTVRRHTWVADTAVDGMVQAAIDEARGSGYTSQRGKSGHIRSLGKE
jgi:excisionase family DNA binding protein